MTWEIYTQSAKGWRKLARLKITDSPTELKQADAVVLPRVGAFDPAVQHLRARIGRTD